MIWLERGLTHDQDTDGHADNVVSFAPRARASDPARVVLSWEDRPGEDNAERCKGWEKRLREGGIEDIVKLHLPRVVMRLTPGEISRLELGSGSGSGSGDPSDGGESVQLKPTNRTLPLPLSYSNYYVANECVVCPVFGDAEYDERAKDTLQEIYGEWGKPVVMFDSTDIIKGGGNLHCQTMEVWGAGQDL